jgi:hypothetical protein
VADSRRSGDEINRWLPNGDLRPKMEMAQAPENASLGTL